MGRVRVPTWLQLYLIDAGGKPVRRLAAFQRVALEPGEIRTIAMTVDPRLLADWENGGWRIRGGNYRFAIGTSAQALETPVSLAIPARRLAP